ncbi:MAG: pyridoxal-dependent decarboxylase [bacterium]
MRPITKEEEKEVDWWFPSSEDEIMNRLDIASKRNLSYQDHPILVFPGTCAHPIACQAFSRFLAPNPNNIMTHTRGMSEKGFVGTQQLEVEVITMLGRMLGDSYCDGYFASGGTEANIWGAWIGRNYLLSSEKVGSGEICVIASHQYHYSGRKACDLLGLGEGIFGECKKCNEDHIFTPKDLGGLHLVGTNQKGEIDLQQLREQIVNQFEKGVRRFMIFLTMGTTMMGAIDDVKGVEKIVEEFPKADFYVHLDAAFGGFIVPFLPHLKEKAIAFHSPIVKSVTIDVHKMGLAPYPAGIALCRKDLQRFIQRPTGYVNSGMDDTVCGSRSGAAAASVWAVMSYLGPKGYREEAEKCMKWTEELKFGLENIGIKVYPHTINILLADLGGKSINEDKYILVTDHMPSDLTDPNSCRKILYKFTLMHHTQDGEIAEFISHLR